MSNKPWPAIVGGKTVWRTAMLTGEPRPWFWSCPNCEKHWIRAEEMELVSKEAREHMWKEHGQ